jgi:hypothetical protein
MLALDLEQSNNVTVRGKLILRMSTKFQNAITHSGPPLITGLTVACTDMKINNMEGEALPAELTFTPNIAQSIHTANVPLVEDNLDHALIVVDTSISPWINPFAWNEADMRHVRNIIKGLASLTDSKEIGCVLFNNTMLYHVRRNIAWNYM